MSTEYGRKNIELYRERVSYYMKMAYRISKKSPDQETKVGCIIVDNNFLNVLSYGYNRFVRTDCNDKLPCFGQEKHNYIIHAEVAAVAEAARRGKSLSGHTAIVTLSPCLHCLRVLYLAGVKTVIFDAWHRTISVERYLQSDVPVDLSDLFLSHNTQYNILTLK